MTVLQAQTALPYPHLERARRGLSAQLRLQLLDAGADWFTNLASMTVTGPERTLDGRGRTWFEYRATVSA